MIEITDDFYYGYEEEGYTWPGLIGKNYSSDCIGAESVYWRLRSPGFKSDGAFFVGPEGSAGWDTTHYFDVKEKIGVRPALYIAG